LDSVDQSIPLLLVAEDIGGLESQLVCHNRARGLAYDFGLGLSQQRKDGNTRVSTDDGDLVLVGLGRLSNDGRNESGSSDNVEVGNTEQPVCQLCDIPESELAYFLGSKTPALLRVSAKTGTVELTGLEMTRMKALGQALAIA
jgi:hypothetical protein